MIDIFINIINIVLNITLIILLLKLFENFSIKREDMDNVKKYVEIISKLRREKKRLLRKLGKPTTNESKNPIDIPNPYYLSLRTIEEEVEVLKNIKLDKSECLLLTLQKRIEAIILNLEDFI